MGDFLISLAAGVVMLAGVYGGKPEEAMVVLLFFILVEVIDRC